MVAPAWCGSSHATSHPLIAFYEGIRGLSCTAHRIRAICRSRGVQTVPVLWRTHHWKATAFEPNHHPSAAPPAGRSPPWRSHPCRIPPSAAREVETRDPRLFSLERSRSSWPPAEWTYRTRLAEVSERRVACCATQPQL